MIFRVNVGIYTIHGWYGDGFFVDPEMNEVSKEVCWNEVTYNDPLKPCTLLFLQERLQEELNVLKEVGHLNLLIVIVFLDVFDHRN